MIIADKRTKRRSSAILVFLDRTEIKAPAVKTRDTRYMVTESILFIAVLHEKPALFPETCYPKRKCLRRQIYRVFILN